VYLCENERASSSGTFSAQHLGKFERRHLSHRDGSGDYGWAEPEPAGGCTAQTDSSGWMRSGDAAEHPLSPLRALETSPAPPPTVAAGHHGAMRQWPRFQPYLRHHFTELQGRYTQNAPPAGGVEGLVPRVAPPTGWRWVTEWGLDKTQADGEGWQYATAWGGGSPRALN
jgi:hypothetical protein